MSATASASSSGLLSSFVSALQASSSVLLVISYGVIAAHLNLLDQLTSKKISGVCVRLFLPALLITRVGAQIERENVLQYGAIIAWSIIYNTASLAIGLLSCKVFHLPSWIIPAITFNNTTSLPLLLVESLKMTGILERLLLEGDTSAKALIRAQSFFLVNSVVGNYLTFAIGPRLIGVTDRHKRRRGRKDDEDDDCDGDCEDNGDGRDNVSRMPATAVEPDEETPLFLGHGTTPTPQQHRNLPSNNQTWYIKIPRQVALAIYGYINPPLVGAVIGTVLGLVPSLHRAFFADTDKGGIFTAWLTQSLRNVGQLFVSLQVVVVGVSLYAALYRMVRGQDSGAISWSSILFVFVVRFAVWPLISVLTVYYAVIPVLTSFSSSSLASSALPSITAASVSRNGKDPILWFTMMLMPTGPPAIKLVALADVSGADSTVKMILSKLLVISYAFSPVLAFTVVAALNASEAAITA